MKIQNVWMLILRYIQLQIMHYISNIAHIAEASKTIYPKYENERKN